MNLTDITSAVEAIAKEAGAFLRKQQSTFSQERVSLKSLNALVSDVDENTERLLVERLSALLPEAGFLTEEETTVQELQKDLVWIIDPLDGTTNFVHGLPIYSVSIALKHKEHLVIGVVYEVGMDECFSAFQGGGARLNGVPITVTTTESLENSLLATGFPYYDFEHIDGFQNTLKFILPINSLLVIGSKICATEASLNDGLAVVLEYDDLILDSSFKL